MRIRIKDIANKAGVSVGTVDRVIHKRGRVAPEVQSRVEAVMTELGYRRNIIASALAYNRTISIHALIFENCDYYWEQTRYGIEKHARPLNTMEWRWKYLFVAIRPSLSR